MVAKQNVWHCVQGSFTRISQQFSLNRIMCLVRNPNVCFFFHCFSCTAYPNTGMCRIQCWLTGIPSSWNPIHRLLWLRKSMPISKLYATLVWFRFRFQFQFLMVIIWFGFNVINSHRSYGFMSKSDSFLLFPCLLSNKLISTGPFSFCVYAISIKSRIIWHTIHFLLMNNDGAKTWCTHEVRP